VTVLLDVQTGIYAAVGLGLLFMLFRLARPPVLLLARIPLSPDRSLYVDETDVNYSPHAFHPPGLLIFRLVESMLYPNAEAISETILATVKARTRCNQHSTSWHEQTVVLPTNTPPLRGLILDLTAVHRIDSTGLATLIHMRKTLDGFAGTSVEWHFAGLRQSRLRRDLIYHGFGSATDDDDDEKAISGKKRSDGEQEPSYAVPRDKYPYFHWDVETAVHFIWTRWNGSAPFSV
jgi:sodium-independent sulfate anion transporter 11